MPNTPNSNPPATMNALLNWLLRCAIASVAFAIPSSSWAKTTPAAPRHPNILVILCDDLGFGDLRCFNPDCRIPTPHCDSLAAQGVRLTDAHAPSSVCTPTRYGLMTGRYAWRSRLQSGVLGGLSPALIEPERLTVAAFLKQSGYHTAALGKWHLGMNWHLQPGTTVNPLGIESSNQVHNARLDLPALNGPTALGFDSFFGISASLDMVPYAWIENDRLPIQPDHDTSFPMTLGIPGRRTRVGPAAPGFDAAHVLPSLTARTVDTIRTLAKDARAGHPFFIYVALNAPHTPILPSPEWQGKSGLNPYADFVMQTDACIGEMIAALDSSGLGRDTLVILTSDNGCSPEADFQKLHAGGHRPSGPFRGAKADIFEGGHRIPMLARWPGRIDPGRVSSHLVSLTDLMATCADILGTRLPDNAGEDSISFLPALTGKGRPRRTSMVQHSINGSFALRMGPWKLALCGDSGGWSSPVPNASKRATLPDVQLYNLADDPAESRNLAAEKPQTAARLSRTLEHVIQRGRSTPGPALTNAVPVVWRH